MSQIIYTLQEETNNTVINYINPQEYTNENYTCQDRTPFVYHIKWSTTNKEYIGARHKINCLPSEIMSDYFTSSIYVKEHIEEHGLPDIIKILNVFDNSQDALDYENKMLLYYDAANNPNFLNKQNGCKDFCCKGHSEETRNKMSKAQQIRPPATKETCLKISKSNKGRKWNDASKAKLRESCKTRPKPSEETKLKTSATLKKQKLYTCEFCGQENPKGNHSQWHGDNCLENPSNTRAEFIASRKPYPKVICEHCNKEVDKANYKKWHGDNCKVLTGIPNKATYARTEETLKRLSDSLNQYHLTKKNK